MLPPCQSPPRATHTYRRLSYSWWLCLPLKCVTLRPSARSPRLTDPYCPPLWYQFDNFTKKHLFAFLSPLLGGNWKWAVLECVCHSVWVLRSFLRRHTDQGLVASCWAFCESSPHHLDMDHCAFVSVHVFECVCEPVEMVFRTWKGEDSHCRYYCASICHLLQ